MTTRLSIGCGGLREHFLLLFLGGMRRHLELLYHFDRVFRILEIYLPEKAEKFSFGLWRFLKQSFFSAVTRD
jgi:hypothetical protein